MRLVRALGVPQNFLQKSCSAWNINPPGSISWKQRRTAPTIGKEEFDLKRIAAALAAVLLTLVLVQPAGASPFTDVPDDTWYAPYAQEALSKGYLHGTGNGCFSPEGTVTYGQFAALLTRIFCPQELENYAGTAVPWYVPACETAASAGILDGSACVRTESGWSSAEMPVTRYEMSLLLYNAVRTAGIPVPDRSEAMAAGNRIADWDSIPEEHRCSAASMVLLGLLSGVDRTGTFAGGLTVTRAQLAAIACRLDALTASP